MDGPSDWGLEALVRSCRGDSAAPVVVPSSEAAEPPTVAAGREVVVNSVASVQPPGAGASPSLYDVLEYLDLKHEQQLPRAPFSITRSCGPGRAPEREVLISAMAIKQAGRRPGGRPPPRRKKRSNSKKSQVKKVVREVPVADGDVYVPDDGWAWRKYGRKPIMGSPYPRGYYKCSTRKACTARKLVDRSPAKPGVLVVTYIGDHCHPMPTNTGALDGTARNPPQSPLSDDTAKRDDESGSASSSVPADTWADGESELWTPVDMDMGLDDIFGAFHDDFDSFFVS